MLKFIQNKITAMKKDFLSKSAIEETELEDSIPLKKNIFDNAKCFFS